MKHIALLTLYCVVLSCIIVGIGCKKESPEGPDALEWQDRAETAERRLAELQQVVRNVRDEKELQKVNQSEAAENMAALAGQLEEALEAQNALTATVEALTDERDTAIKALAESEKTIEELTTYLEDYEKLIGKLEQANKDLQAQLDELVASMAVEEDTVIDEESIIEE